MKIFKLKYLVLIMAFGLLWSCQTEQVLFDAEATTKKVRLPDGIASDADDQYEFDKYKFYHNGTVLNDTTQIKELLKDARGLDINGSRKDIYVTEAELKSSDMYIKHMQHDENQSRSTQAANANNYMHYFYETTRNWINQGKYGALYFNLKGPQSYYTITPNFIVHDVQWNYGATPVHLGDHNSDYLGGSYRQIAHYFNAQNHGTGHYWNQNVSFTINVHNVTRNDRHVYFIHQWDATRLVRQRIYPHTSAEFHGNRKIDGTANFGGLYNFNVARHYSEES